jgi:hypothetical protein
MNRHTLHEYYVQQVLPQLFEHLDRAFPEFNWTRTTIGWKGTRRTENGRLDHVPHQVISCNQPWGFVAADGTAISWLAYVNGGTTPNTDEFVQAICELARRAGVSSSGIDAGRSQAEVQDAIEQQRQTDLLEDFVAYCHLRLASAGGHSVLAGLRDGYGVSVSNADELTVGVYTTTQEVGEHLLRRGFSHEEVTQSAVAGDQRLSSRLIVPWRDCWGQLKTVVARDVLRRQDSAGIDLYLKGGTRTGIFGLDVALRESSEGKKHLVLVDSILDVIYLQSLGVRNTAAITGHNKMPASHHWQQLAQAGVSSVTFAVSDSSAGANQTITAVRESNKARQSPEIHVIATGKFGGRQSAADFVRQHGLAQFRDLLQQRTHGYRYVATDLVGRKRPANSWDETSLTNMLVEAVSFDAEVSDPERALQLERHFWPTILETTGLDWEALRQHLNNRHAKVPADWQQRWSSRNLKQLVRDLRQALKEDDYARFRDLICAAARDLEGERKQPEPVAEFKPPYVPKSVETDYQQWHPLVVHRWHENTRTPLRFGIEPESNGRRWTRSSSPTAADIRAFAYRLWEEDGRPVGRDHEFWFEAERALGLHDQPAYESRWHENGHRAA